MTTEDISKHFLGLPVVLLDAYLTNDMVKRSGLYNMNEIERALLTERQAAEIVARAAAVEGNYVVIDQKVSSGVTDLNAPFRSATGPSSKKRKVLSLVSPSKRLFLISDHDPKKKRLVDFVCHTSLYSGSVDRKPSREDCCSLQEVK